MGIPILVRQHIYIESGPSISPRDMWKNLAFWGTSMKLGRICLWLLLMILDMGPRNFLTLWTKWRPFCWRHYRKIPFVSYLLKYSTHLWYENVYTQVFMVNKHAGAIQKYIKHEMIINWQYHSQGAQNAGFWFLVLLYLHFKNILHKNINFPD